MPFVPDTEQPATSRFVPDVSVAPAARKQEPSLSDTFLSLIAPGGIARMVGAASKSFDKAAYDAGSKITDMAAESKLPAPLAAGLGAAANVGIQALPMFGGGEVAKVASPAFDATGKWLMRKAINPTPTDVIRGRVEPAIKTMLEQGYSPTEGGVAAMRAKVGEYMDQVKSLLDPSTARVDIVDAMQNLNKLKSKFGAGTLGEQKIAEIDSVMRSLQQHPAVRGGTSMSVQDAQAMKQANYRDLSSSAYGLGLKPAAERDAVKAVTSSLKSGIENAVPEVAPLNAKAEELINAIKVSERRAAAEASKRPLPLAASIAISGYHPISTFGAIANSSSAVSGALARAAYSGQEAIPRTLGQLGGGIYGASLGTAPSASLQKLLDDLQRQQNQ